MEYIPSYRSGPYAIIITLHKASEVLEEEYNYRSCLVWTLIISYNIYIISHIYIYIQGVPKKCIHTLNDYKYNVYQDISKFYNPS